MTDPSRASSSPVLPIPGTSLAPASSAASMGPVDAFPVTSQAAITVSERPVKIQIEGQTDWPTVIATLGVGIGSILTSLIVGWLAVRSQRATIRSGVSSLKNEWIRELRQSISQFAGIAGRIIYGKERNPGFLNSEEAARLFSELKQAQCQILLLIGQSDEGFVDLGIDHLMDEIAEELKEGDKDQISAKFETFLQVSVTVTRRAWVDVNRYLLAENRSIPIYRSRTPVREEGTQEARPPSS